MAVPPTYREIEHTADVGMELDAPDLRTALELSAAAMFDMICDLESVGDSWKRVVSVESRDGDSMRRWSSTSGERCPCPSVHSPDPTFCVLSSPRSTCQSPSKPWKPNPRSPQ